MPAPRKFSRRSKKWNSQVVGTHNVRRQSASRPIHQSSYNTRRNVRNLERRAGQIDQMEVESRSVDPSARLEERRSQAKAEQARHRRRMGLLAVVLVALVAFLALVLGNCAFRGSATSAMALDDSDVKNALTAPAEDANAYYVLLAGFADSRESGIDPLQSDSTTRAQEARYVGLLRVDEGAGQVSLLNIPTTMSVNVEGVNGRHQLRVLAQAGGEASLVKAVSAFAGVPISHYARIDERGLVNVVDAMGGIRVNVSQTVDDPTFSSLVIDSGEQTLSGEQAVTYAYAGNYADAVSMQAVHQQELLSALLQAAHSRGGLDYTGFVDEVSKNVKTDMDLDTFEALQNAYTQAEMFYPCVVAGSTVTQDGVDYYVASTKNWPTMQQRFADGEDPSITVDTSGVDKAKVNLVVLNGSGVTGLANEVSERLKAAGYNVAETGNADSYVYDETLVIYRTKDYQLEAEAVVQDLGMGRAVSASVYYNLHSNVQVVVGKDWKPQE